MGLVLERCGELEALMRCGCRDHVTAMTIVLTSPGRYSRGAECGYMQLDGQAHTLDNTEEMQARAVEYVTVATHGTDNERWGSDDPRLANASEEYGYGGCVGRIGAAAFRHIFILFTHNGDVDSGDV